MEPELSHDDLRVRTGAAPELLRDCVEAGVLSSGGDPPRFERLDVERLRLVALLVRRGFTLDQISCADS